MSTPTIILARMTAVGTIFFLAGNAESQLVATGNLYQNAAPNYQSANFNNANSEEGNQIVLAGASAFDLITSFSFQFDYTGSLGSPNASADVKFYENNGAPVNGYASPGTVLFDSGSFSIGGYTSGETENFYAAVLGGGTGAGVVPGVGVDVPQDFTWTVTFSGLQAGENAGLALYYPPTVGSDALPNGDAWVNVGTGLEPANLSGNPLEFGSVFNGTPVLVPEPGIGALTAIGSLFFGTRRWFPRRNIR